MGYPNQSCGECGYWLAFGEPETTEEEENEKIVEHCKHCTRPCGILDKEYYKMIKTAQLQILLRKAISNTRRKISMNNCPFELYIPDVGICCKAYYESKRPDGKDWCHFPRCYDDKCPLKHPELLEGAKLEGIEI